MKTVWIINYYTAPPSMVSNPRHYEFAKKMKSAGYQVRVFSSGFLRENNLTLVPKGQKYINEVYEGLHYTHISCMPYLGNGIKRGLSIFQFAWRIYRLRKNFETPDLILFNIHAPFDYPIIWCAKKLKAKLIVEAWDLWPDGFVRFGLMKANNPIVKVSYWVEKLMYEEADRIIFTFEGGLDYLAKRKYLMEQGGKINSDRVYYINNGINLQDFENNRLLHPTKDVDLLDGRTIKILYLGAIRLVNDVKKLIDAAEILKSHSNIKFIIIGDGSDRQYLEQYCNENNISNVLFKEKNIPFNEIPDVVSRASINIMNYQKGFGIYGVSSGKQFLYFAANSPICCNIKLNYCEIAKNDLGIAEDLNTPQEYAEAILKLSSLSSDELKAMRNRLRETAERFDYEKLSSDLMKIFGSI